MSICTNKTRLFVLEDNELTREMVKSLLQQVSDFEVVGEATRGEDAVDGVVQSEADIILADIGLPGIDGIEAVRQIRRAHPTIRAIMLTAHDTNEDLFQSFRAGAEGYILKTGLTPRRLELAVKSVEDGSVWLDPLIAERVLTAAVTGGSIPTARPTVEPLSCEEISVLEKVATSTPQCEYGVCSVEPSFLAKLKRFSNQDDNHSLYESRADEYVH